ncbi:hypothetical protein JCM31271_26790 [Halorubrum trueperi]
MTTPINAEAESYSRSTHDSNTGESVVWPLLECLGGGISAGVVFLLLLPMLADVMSSFGALAPTGLLITLLFLWLFLWMLTAVARERVGG